MMVFSKLDDKIPTQLKMWQIMTMCIVKTQIHIEEIHNFLHITKNQHGDCLVQSVKEISMIQPFDLDLNLFLFTHNFLKHSFTSSGHASRFSSIIRMLMPSNLK